MNTLAHSTSLNHNYPPERNILKLPIHKHKTPKSLEMDGRTPTILWLPTEVQELILFQHTLSVEGLKFILTNVQRTCRAWHELIRVSPQIQQALFLKPVYYQLKDGRQPKKNPVLADTIIQHLADQYPGVEISKISRQFDPWPPAKLAAYGSKLEKDVFPATSQVLGG